MITDRDRSEARFCCLDFCNYRQGQRLHESLSRGGLQQGLGEHGGAGGLGSRMGGGFLRFSSVDTLLSGATRFIRFLNCQTSSQPLSDAGGAGDGGRQEKVPQCQTVSSLVDKPQDPQGGWKEQSEWDLLCNNDTLIREPSEYDIWRDILVQQKPVAGGSEGMKTSRTWTQA